MPLLARAPLASLVCPSMPFLLPRLLRVPGTLPEPWICLALPIAIPQRGLKTRRKGAKVARSKNAMLDPNNPRIRKLAARMDDEYHQARSLGIFLDTCEPHAISKMMELYPTVVGSLPLTREHTRRIVAALHNYIRNRVSSERIQEIFPFLERMVQDLRSGALPSHPYAHVHILGIYKECKKFDEGNMYWQWLVDRGEGYVDPAVYGAAIELLAYQGTTSLEDLEALYTQALKRFPGTFAEYHLSPDAIVPDRTQPTTIVGLPMILLQGILTARILARDWKRAYLALDTALRLYPADTPKRFFEIFMLERPLSEAYTIFLIACRSGALFKPTHLTMILLKLNRAMKQSNDLKDRVTILQAMANTMYAYIEVGGSIGGPHVGCFLNSFGDLLPWRLSTDSFGEHEVPIRDMIVATAYETLSSLIQAGMPPQQPAFIALIRLAGLFETPSLLSVTLQDAKTVGQDLGASGRRNVLIAAGANRNTDLVEQYWSLIALEADREGKHISPEDWVTLARVCRRIGHRDFFIQQLEKLSHTMTTSSQRNVMLVLEEKEYAMHPRGVFKYMSLEVFASEMEKLKTQIRNVAAVVMSGQPLDLRKTPFFMFVNPAKETLGSAEDLRAVYDEFTTDPHQPQLPVAEQDPKTTPIRLSRTGIPLDELRYQNWVTIMELMKEAEATEAEFQLRVDEAIASRRKVDRSTAVFFHKNDSEAGSTPSRDQVRATIRRLRDPSVVTQFSSSQDRSKAPGSNSKGDSNYSTGARPLSVAVLYIHER
ncbi:hypothetical protein CC78DRAFT_372637 [Lojkania enalia]|uniref:Uncharacterized protein n=1 Tax=Lojkania enalia TaxID=147567 RepID=A0A9P4N897_9PLEO|nr:hypothetical protein CC78DRAFT_372637 [Didymosphaeria enalia]